MAVVYRLSSNRRKGEPSSFSYQPAALVSMWVPVSAAPRLGSRESVMRRQWLADFHGSFLGTLLKSLSLLSHGINRTPRHRLTWVFVQRQESRHWEMKNGHRKRHE